jgi:hypothetical protein
MTIAAGSRQSFPGGIIDENAAPHPVISTVGAEWRNLTPKGGGPWWQAVYYHMAAIRRDCEEMITIFSQPFFDDSRSFS